MVAVSWYTLSVGSFSLPTVLFVMFLMGWLFEKVVCFVGFKPDLSELPSSTYLILFGLLFSRLGYVLLNITHYWDTPWDIINIRDRGFSFFVPLSIFLLWLLWARRGQILKIGLGFAITMTIAYGIVKWGQSQETLVLNDSLKLEVMTGNNKEDGRTIFQQEGKRLKEILTEAKLLEKPVIIHVWASWCPPCRREMPAFAKIESQRSDVLIIWVNSQESLETVSLFLDDNHLAIDQLVLDSQGSVMSEAQLVALPSTLFWDKRGQFRGAHTGEMTYSGLQAKIEQLNR